MKILVTGFDAFGGEAINPSYEAVRRLPEEMAGAQLLRCALPTSFARGRAEIARLIALHRPDLVLNVGQAGGAAGLRVERVAVNLADARIPDNDGAQPVDQPLVPGGPAAYFAAVPVRAMVRAVQAQGCACQISDTAGTYVCNAVMYTALHLRATQYPGMRAGFVHLPYIPEQLSGKAAGTPAVPLPALTAALQAALEAAAAE